MGFELKQRFIIIITLLLLGAGLATAVTKYIDNEPPLNHHVTSGKVGSNTDGTVWVAEFIKDKVVFNYTLPESSVHSKYLYYEAVSIVAVPEYTQEFEIINEEESQYNIYIPQKDATVSVSNLEAYMRQHEDTILLEGYAFFSKSINDIRVLSKIHESKFAINGIVTLIHNDRTTTISGYILTVEENHYMVIMSVKENHVKEIRKINFEYK